MIFPDPVLDHLNEIFGPGQNLFRLSLGGNEGVIVINGVPLSPAPVEVVAVRVGSFANCEFDHIERNPVMPRTDDAIASTRNCHFCSLECCIVGGREASVRRGSVQRCISQIATDDGSQFVEFFLRSLVSLNFVICE
jgi:hypothetical protein